MTGDSADVDMIFIKAMLARRYTLDYIFNLNSYERMIHWAAMLEEGSES